VLDKLQKLCRKIDADYAELRVHEGSSSSVHYAGKELEDIGERTGLGGCVRVLKNGGWGFTSFNDIGKLEKYAQLALRQAELVNGEPFTPAAVEPVKEVYLSEPENDPAGYSLSDKKSLAEKYNRLLLAEKRITTTNVSYRDSSGTRYLATSDGTVLEQGYSFCGMTIAAIAVDGTNVQRAYKGSGDLRGFGNVLDMESDCEDVKKRALESLDARPVNAGLYDVIIDPKLCGVFVHEAFGHLSEADHIYENPKLRRIMQPGKRFGPEYLNIVDDGSLKGEAGHIAFDDEGVRSGRTPLIENGVLVGRLHNRETAAKMGEEPTGNARAISHSSPPIVRMTNTFMEPGEWNFDDMLEDTEDGLYAVGMLGGQTNTEMFTFSAEEAWRIEKGKLTEKVRDVVLSGNVFKTLANIDAVGNDFRIFGGLGGCGKGGQSPLRVGDGGPHCRIRNVVIGGR